MPNVQVKERYLFDDLIEYGFRIPPIHILNDPHAVRIGAIGKGYGLTLETFYSPQHEKFIIFARNGHGFRWIFLFVEELGGGFRPLDSRTTLVVRQVLWYNQNKRRFFKEMREQRWNESEEKSKKEKEEFNYVCSQHRRLFRMLGRALGMSSSGKTRLPY